MQSDVYKPRFSFEVTEKQKLEAEKYLSAHGVKRAVFAPILDDVISKIKQHGETFIIAISARYISPSDCLPSIKSALATVEKVEKANG